jgi:hypothetical protein
MRRARCGCRSRRVCRCRSGSADWRWSYRGRARRCRSRCICRRRGWFWLQQLLHQLIYDRGAEHPTEPNQSHNYRDSIFHLEIAPPPWPSPHACTPGCRGLRPLLPVPFRGPPPWFFRVGHYQPPSCPRESRPHTCVTPSSTSKATIRHDAKWARKLDWAGTQSPPKPSGQPGFDGGRARTTMPLPAGGPTAPAITWDSLQSPDAFHCILQDYP